MSIRPVGSLILACACLALVASLSQARPIEIWEYERLFKESTLVVVVKPLSVRDATAKDKAVAPTDEMTGMVTTFKILVVVKGEYKDKKLDLIHFRLKPSRLSSINPPLLVTFINKPAKPVSVRHRYQDDFLLFLKNDKDSRWTFVAGQFDAALSVK
jgi:hypothetical protein